MPIPYTGEALKTYERIHVLRSYHYNKLYISPDKIIYHINRHGFLHAYTAGKCKDYDGSKIYYIRDNLLTRENLLRESLTTFYHSKEEAKAAWEAMQADAEANTSEERPQEAATDTGTTAGGETTTRTDKAPQEATSEATTGPETSTATQDTTGSDTRPPRAQEANQEPGHAAGDHTEPAADHITGPTTGNTSGAAAEAITGRTTTPPQNPGHACENAPGRTERTTAEQVHTPHAKSPPRGKTQGRHTTTGSRRIYGSVQSLLVL